MENVLGILVGGGPAPGINGVINSAALEAINCGYKVIGIRDGFEHLIRGDSGYTILLNEYENLGRIHFLGGSILGTSRANPTKDPLKMKNTINALRWLGLTHLLTIGGDDTAFSAYNVSLNSDIKVLHVPKTIDNDLPLPYGYSTFGFHTARHVGGQLVKSLMTDAKTTGRWYFVQAMGRKAGHLALAIGKSTGATLTIIPEDFEGEQKIPLLKICKILVGSVLKRFVIGKKFGVAMVAEGLVERIDQKDLAGVDHVERDDHGHIRYSEMNFVGILKSIVQRELQEMNLNLTIVDKEIGYELRSVEPVSFDQEYVRDLGFAAISKFEEGVTNAMITIQNGEVVPMSFIELLDEHTGKTKVRMVNPNSFTYKVAQKYMIKLNKHDLDNSTFIGRVTSLTGMSRDRILTYFDGII